MPTKITQNGRKKINVAGTIHSNSQEVALVGHTHNTYDINGLSREISNAIDSNNSTVRSIVNNTIYENLKTDKNKYTYVDNNPKDGVRGSKVYTLISKYNSNDAIEPEIYHIVFDANGKKRDLYIKLNGRWSSEIIYTNINMLDDKFGLEFEHYSGYSNNRYFMSVFGGAKVLSISHFGYIDLTTDLSKDDYKGYGDIINILTKINWRHIPNDTGYNYIYETPIDSKYLYMSVDPMTTNAPITITHFPGQGFVVYGMGSWKISESNGKVSDRILYSADNHVTDIILNGEYITYIFSRTAIDLPKVTNIAYSDKQDYDLFSTSLGVPIYNRSDSTVEEKYKTVVFLINKYILKNIKEDPVLPDLKGRINGVLFTGKQDINITVPSLSTNHTINGVAFNGTQDITITARAAGGNADTLGNLNADQYVKVTDVANAAGKIPRFNAAGHLVYPDGHEEWIE